MDKVDPLKQLSDAADLLNMLEHLTDGFAKSDERSLNVPWPGVRLTLGHARQLMLSAYEKLFQGGYAEPAPRYPEVRSENRAESRPDARPEGRATGASLAERITPVPTHGRVRELGPNGRGERSRGQSKVSADMVGNE